MSVSRFDLATGIREYAARVEFRRREEEDSSLFGATLGALGALAIGVGMWWLAAYIDASVDGDVLVPVAEGRFAGAPTLVLLALFGFGGLVGVAAFGFLAWLIILTAWEGRRGRA